jgi:hypothetical protein
MTPTEVIHLELVRSRREDARIAAMILLSEPQRIGNKPIVDFLRLIKCMDDEEGQETIGGWLRRAGVNPLRPSSKLTKRERDLIAGQLVRFWKGQK